MIAEELINQLIPPLKLSDDAHKALVWMEELRLDALPVVDHGKFLGMINEDLILQSNNIEKKVRDFQLIHQDCLINSQSHVYEVLKLAGEKKAKMVCIVDDNQEYLGVITVEDTVTGFAQSAAVQLPGSILVLSLKKIDYSLAEISRLIEENKAKILSSSVKDEDNDNSMMRLTLKINVQDITSIEATLDRFGYKVIARFQDAQVENNQQERLDMLFKYLDI